MRPYNEGGCVIGPQDEYKWVTCTDKKLCTSCFEIIQGPSHTPFPLLNYVCCASCNAKIIKRRLKEKRERSH